METSKKDDKPRTTNINQLLLDGEIRNLVRQETNREIDKALVQIKTKILEAQEVIQAELYKLTAMIDKRRVQAVKETISLRVGDSSGNGAPVASGQAQRDNEEIKINWEDIVDDNNK